MLDSNWKTWSLLGLIALGLSFELIKKLPGQDYALADGEMIQSAGPAEPFAIRLKNLLLGKSSKPERKKARVAGRVATPRPQTPTPVQATDPAAAPLNGEDKSNLENKNGQNKKAALEKCDENNPKLDPITGQPLPCKKKKKKKLAELKEEPSPLLAQKEETSSDDDLDQLMGNAIATGQLPRPVGKKAETVDSLEEWVRRLLNSPDPATTKIFIDHHQRKLVTEEIYYEITEMMLNDSRSEMKQLGVLCAGLSPSVPSFTLLAQLVDKEPTSSSARRDAEGFLAKYEDLSRLGILEAILRSPSLTHATLLAAHKLEASIRKHLGSEGNSPNPDPNSSKWTQVAAQFKRFISVLEALLQSKNHELKEFAEHTLTHLQSFYSQENTQVGPGTSPSEASTQASASE